MALRIAEEAGITDVGRQRQTNEDRFYESPSLFAVADGMGGARSGEVASQIAVDELASQSADHGSPEERLAEIVRSANRKIYDLAQSDESHAGMGTTLTAALVGDDEITIGHVGDSRAYRFRDGRLERLTEDHSLVEELVRMGRLSPEDAEADPRRSIITRALGPEPTVDVETSTYPARDGDIYLLCSDGLTGMVPEQRVAEILRARSSLEQAARELVDAANAAGGKDNITVVLFKLADEGADEPRDEDTLAGTERAPVRESGDGKTIVIPPPAETAELEPAAPQSAIRGRRPVASARRRQRWPLVAAVVLIIVVAAAGGLYAATRQVYFVGTDRAGLITLYRGLPYELPFGIKLYDSEYESSVPAMALPPRQRSAVLDNRLRGRTDAVNLVRTLERSGS